MFFDSRDLLDLFGIFLLDLLGQVVRISEIFGSSFVFIRFYLFAFLPSVLEQISCHAARGARPAKRGQLCRKERMLA